MELLENPSFKSKYHKSKSKVKQWESGFMEKYGRKPNKNDIKEADVSIRDAYKMYWKLKTRALEETLMDITFSDDVQANISTCTLNTSVAVDSVEKNTELPPDVCNTENCNPEIEKLPKETDFEAVPTEIGINAEGAWGSHLNNEKKVVQKKENLLVGRSSSFQLSQKLFNSTSFTKRNPRKSLSMVKSKSRSDLDTSMSSLIQKDGVDSQTEDGFNPNEIMKPILGDKVKVSRTEGKISSQPVSAIHQLIAGKAVNISRKIDAGWLERCSDQNYPKGSLSQPNRLSGISDSGVESLESSTYSPYTINTLISSQTPPLFSDEEDFVCGSDSEGERKNKRVRNIRIRASSVERQAIKRPCREPYLPSLGSLPSSQETLEINSSLPYSVKTVESSLRELSIPRNSEIEVNITDKKEVKLVTDNTENSNTQNQCDEITAPKEVKEQLVAAAPTTQTVKRLNNRNQNDTSDNSEFKAMCNDSEKTEEVKRTPPMRTTKEAAPTTRTRQRASRKILQKTPDNSDCKSTRTTGTTKNTRQTQRKAYRRIQENTSDDSESDAMPESKIADEVTKKTRKTRTTCTTRKTAQTKRTQKKNDENVEIQTTRPIRKPPSRASKKEIVHSPTREKNELVERPEPQIYGVDTVNAVPRFALPRIESGDLVANFSQVISKSLPTDRVTAPEASGSNSKKKLTDKERLAEKISTGRLNENFVRINLKKKVFVRGKKTMTFQKYKKNQWKQKKKELASGAGSLDLADLVENKGILKCFKCGDIGHFSKECKSLKSDELLPLIGDEEPCEYPTLDEAAKMASESVLAAHRNRISIIPQTSSRALLLPHMKDDENNENQIKNMPPAIPETVPTDDENIDSLLDDLDFADDIEINNSETVHSGHIIPEHLLAKLLPPEIGPVKPLYPKELSDQLSATPNDVLEALQNFGHEAFRPGQEKAVMRILSGQSTLVTLSTGAGKSLCYQLPAYLYAKHSRCITLVISPLVSLMDDQVTGVPKFLSAACLHTALAAKQRTIVMDKVKAGTLDILLVSPEAVVAGEKSTGFGALLRQLPPIAFACIDEAHCISQWSHNFRPSYLMVCKVLREKLGVKTILGLTATATKSTAESIVNYLNIPDGMAGVISDTPLPRNLTLTASKDQHRDHALIELLRSQRFENLDSLIVYCTRRDECVRIAGLLRTSLTDPKSYGKSEKKVSPIAEAYHAGLSASRRKVVQKAFMNGDTRIVVATVAFGMGINKPDIRAVIHFNMPSNFESYVQEVGRSGRDGLPAHCHVFISSETSGDKAELRRHIYANGVDRHMIRRLLQKVFVPCSCANTGNPGVNKRCPGHEVAIPVDEIVMALDIPQEIISTLLCYLELHPKKFITTLPSVYINAKVTSYNGPKALKIAAQSSPPLAMAIALDLKRGVSHENSSIIEFPVVDVAAAIGWDSGVVKGHLKDLEWKNTETGGWKRTAISVNYDTLGFRVRAPGDLSNAELDEALDLLTERTSTQQRMGLYQLEAICLALSKVSVDSVRQCRELTENLLDRSEALKKTIREYFQSENPMEEIDLKLETKLLNDSQIASDVRNLVHCYRDSNFTGRAVARIFHGIQSPNYSALVWSRCKFWRAHLSVNFELICQIATREILAMR
ncbi:uncharacterized protein LOC105691972 [Athalia rosae]|uniref:uncharacterized protein LOC105691972 n=1 Tax=Athalia rosae TaxID=37344 RepID=UPI002033B9A4|nr:uncharacterized protein LOC105691972 [Athalia rosae]